MCKIIFFFLLNLISFSFSNIPVETGEGNLRRIEKDLHILQQFVYKRFGGDPAYHEAEISPPADPSQTLLLEKMNSLNDRSSDLVSKIEELQHKMSVLETSNEQVQKDLQMKQAALELRLQAALQDLKKEKDLSYQQQISDMTADQLISQIQTEGPRLSEDLLEKTLLCFVEKFPEDIRVASVYLQLIELLYKKENYKSAALYAGEFYKKQPNTKEAAEVLLLMAFSLHKLGKSKEACTTLEKIKDDYPNIDTSFKERVEKAATSYACSP